MSGSRPGGPSGTRRFRESRCCRSHRFPSARTSASCSGRRCRDRACAVPDPARARSRASGHRGRLAVADAAACVRIPGSAEVRTADETLVNLLDDLDRPGPRALLVAHLHDAVEVCLGQGDQLALPRVVRAWFLAVHVLAGLECENGCRGVPEIWRGDDQGIDRLVVEDAAEVGDALRWRRARWRDVLDCGHDTVPRSRVDIADVGDFGVRR